MAQELNENIRELRLAAGLNQVEFAQKMNVTKQCVSNWENDNVQPSIEMLVRMADFSRSPPTASSVATVRIPFSFRA